MSVPARFIHIGFNFYAPALGRTAALEKTFNLALDWIRYEEHCWILYSNTELDTWRDRIRKLPSISENDSFFLTEFSQGEYSGYQHKAVWDFMGKAR